MRTDRNKATRGRPASRAATARPAGTALPRILWALIAATVLLGLQTLPLAGQVAQDEAAEATDTLVAEDTVVVDTVIAERTRPYPQQSRGDVVSVLGGSRTIEAGEVVGDAVVIGGSLHVRGTVTGDAVVLGGSLTTYEGSDIRGDVVVLGGRVIDRGGTVGGETTTRRTVAPTARTRTEARGPSAFTRVGRGIAGIFSTLALGLVLAGAGALLVFYGRRPLENVSDTIRQSAIRSGVTGLAVGFLVLPGFVFLVLALTISIIGIPLLLVAVPLYPIAVIVATGFGLLAAAHAIGERTVEGRQDFTLRYRNSYAYLFFGLAILLLPLIAAHMLGMTGFLGWVAGLVRFVAYVAIWLAAVIGIGAVVLSRAGTRRPVGVGPVGDPLADEPLFDEDEALR
jgi:hypothetical protein